MKKTEPPREPKDKKARDFITGVSRPGLSHTLFVRAGAGAGKTHCLQERVKNLLLHHDCMPEKLAVITYTTKAAAEIKDRIRLAIEKAASSNADKELQTKAAVLLDELNKSKMSTVHAFCFDLLKEYPVEFGIDPVCQIADDRATAALKREVQRLFYEAEAINDPQFKAELEARKRLNEEFPNAVREDHLFSFFGVLYQNRELKARRLPSLSPKALTKLKGEMNALLVQLVADITIGIEKAIAKNDDKLYLKREEILQRLAIHGIITSKKSQDCSALLEAVLLSGSSPFPHSAGAKGNYKDPEFLAGYKERAGQFKGLLETYRQEQAVNCYHLLLDIYPLYSSLYQSFKRSHGLLDFADCLILLRNGLRDKPFLKSALQSRFDVIIVDEFQDSDPLQSEILIHLASANVDAGTSWEDLELVPGKLTFMGDPKQSIFGFARADISIYLKVMKLITANDTLADQVLSTNFRSLPGVLEFVNQHFDKIITKHETEPFASPEYDATK